MVTTTSDWTAFFASGIQGSDPFPAMSHLAQVMGVLSMRVCVTPPGSRWPATVWEVYGPEALGGVPPLGYRRSIAASNDGGRWIFEQSGAPFPFEKQAAYELPRKRDRFTPALLAEYLQAMGLVPFDDQFYIVDGTHPAILVDTLTAWKVPAPEYSLEEVVEGRPWR